jgi:Uma2 family endonuclease
MGITTALMTFAEFEQLPDEPGKLELLKGDLIRMPPAFWKHGKVSKLLFRALDNLVERARAADPKCPLGEVYFEMGYRVSRNPDSWLIPDVSVMHPNQPINKYAEGAPLIAIEIISESNAARQVDAKVLVYLAGGASEVWVLYPETRRVWTHFSGREAAEVSTGGIRSELIPSASQELRLEQILG